MRAETWTASSGADWISITAGASGVGNGRVVFTVATNSGNDRVLSISATAAAAGYAAGAARTSGLGGAIAASSATVLIQVR